MESGCVRCGRNQLGSGHDGKEETPRRARGLDSLHTKVQEFLLPFPAASNSINDILDGVASKNNRHSMDVIKLQLDTSTCLGRLGALSSRECQAMLLNFDEMLEKEFGEKYCLRESLSLSLQLFPFSNLQRLNTIRNRVMHPTRLESITEEDFLFARDMYRKLHPNQWRDEPVS